MALLSAILLLAGGTGESKLDPGDLMGSDVRAGAALAAATLLSEDLTCVAAGGLLQTGRVGWPAAVGGCLLGIYLGDLGLWLVGRAAGRVTFLQRWMLRRVTPERLADFATWFERRTVIAIFIARFVPGLRLPLYLAAGATGRGGLKFAAWTFLAALLWTPLVVGGVALLGDAVAGPLRSLSYSGWVAIPVGVAVAWLGVVWVGRARPLGRARFVASVSRLWRWEFWPAWLFYAPVAGWIFVLSIRRGGLSGFARITAANPGIPDGGFVGESKRQILGSLPADSVIPFRHIAPGAIDERLSAALAHFESAGWQFPLILKPDVGQRGAGVRLARTADDVADYLRRHPEDILMQPYHPGPGEVGVFYYRLPGASRGRIFSITEKVFPAVVGDGRSTLAELIWSHPRYRMQADRFLERHASIADRIVPTGEQVSLAVAGNHCQGTLFRDGWHLWTPELESAIDRIARQFDDFHFGRFDIRYRDIEAFRSGRDVAIVELNGVTSESTDIYDPNRSLWSAWTKLLRQWNLLFAIADANVARGHRPTDWRSLWARVQEYWRRPPVDASAD